MAKQESQRTHSPSHWTRHHEGRGHAQRLDPLLHGRRGRCPGAALILCCHRRRRCSHCQSLLLRLLLLLLLLRAIDADDAVANGNGMIRREGIARIATLRIQAPERKKK